MPLDLTSFAAKLARYRKQFDASIEQVSSATGIPGAKLVEFESANRTPTGDEVLILADYFKCDYKFFISNDQLGPIEQTEKLFRKFAKELTPNDRWAIQEFLFLCECEGFLTSALGRQPRTAFVETKVGTFYKGHGEHAAASLRRHLGYAPSEVPKDVYADFRSIGVHVFRRELENSNVSGLYLRHPTAGKCVLINYSEDVYRQRFTAAHEAGHSILDDEADFVVSFAKWDHKDLVEVRANAFAAHFLLPPEFVDGLPRIEWSEEAIVDVSNRLRVNVDTLLFALKRQGRITDASAARFKGLKISRVAKIDPELPDSLSDKQRARKADLLRRGLSDHFVRLCFDAYDQGVVSAGRIAEMMLVDERALVHIAGIYGRSFQHGS